MDLAEHAATVWSRRFLVVLGALVVAALVVGWRSAAPERFESTSTLQVRVATTESDPALQVDYYAQTVVALLGNDGVVGEAVRAAGQPTPGSAADVVTATTTGEPGFIEVTTTSQSSTDAAVVNEVVVTAVQRRIAETQSADLAIQQQPLLDAIARVADQLSSMPSGPSNQRSALVREREDLQAALRAVTAGVPWQLAVVERAEAPTSPVAPRPLRDGLLAFLVALLFIAEGVVVARAWRGAISVRDPAREVARLIEVPAYHVGAGDPPSAVGTLLPFVTAGVPTLVLHRGRRPSARTACLLGDLLADRGHSVLVVDADLDPVDDVVSMLASHSADQVVIAASSRRLVDAADLLSAVAGPVVLSIDPTRATRRELQDEAAVLRGLGCRVVAAIVEDGGTALRSRMTSRRPNDPLPVEETTP